jgi:hypothetical protein
MSSAAAGDVAHPTASLPGLTWLDPAIHLHAKKMDPRVKPAGDGQKGLDEAETCGLCTMGGGSHFRDRLKYRRSGGGWPFLAGMSKPSPLRK